MTIETQHLTNKRNLLGFSAGVDSTALFHLLIEHGISFDIAIVDYGTRAQAKLELEYARALAAKHTLICHTAQAPKFNRHFEQNAREFRYGFFDSLIQEHNYDNLLTAHQLNDQLEWLLMRLTKGAGVSELIGLESITDKKNYSIIRPLLQCTKQELIEYLETNNHKYFIDDSNKSRTHERNRFRLDYSDRLLSEFGTGIKRSIDYLREDKHLLSKNYKTIQTIGQLHIIKLYNIASKSKAADITLKRSGYLLSSAQRTEIESNDSIVIGGKWAVELRGDILYIAPYSQINIPKQTKEKYRLAKIPPKIRPYMFENNIDTDKLSTD